MAGNNPTAAGLIGIGPTPRVLSAAASLNANTTTEIIAAPSNTKQIVVLSLSATGNGAAAGLVSLRSGANTVKWHAYLPTVPTTGAPSGIVEPPIPGGELFRCATNTALNGTTAAITNPIYVNVRYIYEDP